MDSALRLRIKYDNNEKIEQPIEWLKESEIVAKYTQLTDLTTLGKIFALIGLAEIPYASQLPQTQELITFVNQHVATSEGFSYTGKLEEIVPCYNALLLEAYCRLGLGNTPEAQNALQWIKQYQVFEREQTTSWAHKGICKYGGCMKATPCYIGIGKTVRALLTYQEIVTADDQQVKHLIQVGLDYMLRHQLFRRLSNQKPISAHITESMFPQSYTLSFTDLVYIAEKGQLREHKQTQALTALLLEKRRKSGGWKNEYIYKYKGYLAFDNRRNDSDWLTYLYTRYLK